MEHMVAAPVNQAVRIGSGSDSSRLASGCGGSSRSSLGCGRCSGMSSGSCSSMVCGGGFSRSS